MASFDRIKRISHLLIHWAFCPGEYSIEVSPDRTNWKTIAPWTSTHDSNWIFLAKNYWWWRDHYQSFVQLVKFEEPEWILQFKIKMRKPVYQQFGLYRVEAFTLIWTLMIRSAASSETNECIVTSSGMSPVAGTHAELMDCVEAISLFDGRELWVMHHTYAITHFYGGLCLEAKNSQTDDSAEIVVNECNDTPGQKFVMDHKGLLRIMLDPNKCVTAVASAEFENVAYNQRAEASSSLNDGQHVSQRVVDGTDSYWASGLGVPFADFKIIFEEPKTIKKVKIIWKFPPLAFAVSGLTMADLWQEYHAEGHNSKLESEIQTGPRVVKAIKVEMKRAHPTLGKLRDKDVFGIVRIIVSGAGKAIKFRNCNDGDEGGTNKWILQDMEYTEITESAVVNEERAKTLTSIQNLLPTLNSILAIPHPLAKVLEKAKEMRKTINDQIDDLKALAIKMTMYQKFLIEPSQADPSPEPRKDLPSAVGSGSLNPGKDCFVILKAYPSKLSGFFWIRPSCSTHSIRVYCDFEFSNANSYAYLGSTEEDKNMVGLRYFEDVQYECAKIGLSPVHIKNKDQLFVILRYIKDMKLPLNKGEVIPLGHDYGCDSNACSKRYKSFSASSSPDITEAFASYKDTSNILNMAFSSGTFSSRDTVGVGMTEEKVFYFGFTSFPIKGLICSTNTDGKSLPDMVTADCHTMARGNPDFNGPPSTFVKVFCPGECVPATTAQVWGAGVYKDDSSVCRAGIHSGAIENEEGGKILVGLREGQTNYDGASGFGVESQLFIGEWDRSFTVLRMKERCPIDEFMSRFKRESSFIEESGFLRYEGSPRFRSKQEATASTAASTDSTETKESTSSTNSTETKKSAFEGAAEETDFDSIKPVKIESSDEAKLQLSRIYHFFNKDLIKTVKLVKETEKLVQEINSHLGILVSTDISSTAITVDVGNLEIAAEGTSAILTQLTNKASAKVKRFERTLQLATLEKLKLEIYKPYIEVYYFWITDIYEIYDFPAAENRPSNWQFVKRTINGHESAIAQTSQISCKQMEGCTSTLLMLKYKEFHDSVFKASFLMMDAGIVGMVFRMSDEFNYYLFEISQRPPFQRVRRVVNGESQIVFILTDGYVQNVWYRVIINVSHTKYEVRFGKEAASDDDGVPVIMTAEDQFLARGRFGFISNGNSALFIDKFSVSAAICIKQADIPNIDYMPAECSRKKENYFGSFATSWNVIDPPGSTSGPSMWQYAAEVLDHPKVISQNSRIHTKNPTSVPTMALLHPRKTCKDGYITVDFAAATEGVVGVVFRYINRDNFLLFEVGGGSKKFVRYRKFVDGRDEVVSKSDTDGYEVMVWYRITLYLLGDMIKFIFHQPKEAINEPFPMSPADDSLKDGRVGLITFKASASFDNFRMCPIGDLDNESGEGDDDKGPKDTAVKATGGAKNEKVYANENSKKMDWSTCLVTKTPEARAKDCENKFQTLSNDAVKNCKENYCQECCESVIDALHNVQRLTCRKECTVTTTGSKSENKWGMCVNPPRPPSSIYMYCEKMFVVGLMRNKCKLDFCSLCCVTSETIVDIRMEDKSLADCHTKCIEVFQDPKDIII